jgi:hypothetical protein
MPISVTALDIDALLAVKKAGFVGVEQGGVFLETNTQITQFRLDRLLAHGFLVSSEDGLLDGCAQTYRVSSNAP